MTIEQMVSIVRARQALFAAMEGAEEDKIGQIHQAADTLLAIERLHPALQRDAFAALAGPREEWEIA